MSTGQECSIFGTKDNRYFLVLEQDDAPQNAWDWTEYADVYGPFASEAAAETYLSENFANPGGIYDMNYVDEEEENVRNLIARAVKPRVRRPYGW